MGLKVEKVQGVNCCKF